MPQCRGEEGYVAVASTANRAILLRSDGHAVELDVGAGAAREQLRGRPRLAELPAVSKGCKSVAVPGPASCCLARAREP